MSHLSTIGCFVLVYKERLILEKMQNGSTNGGGAGWQSNQHFLFIVVDSRGHAAGACDIKTSDLYAAEIGYWASKEHRGIMTNAVRAMLEAGFTAGFQRFYAHVRPGNTASSAVLQRLGFVSSSEFAETGYEAFALSKNKSA